MNTVVAESAVPETAGPHRWQVAPWARVVRAAWRHRAYTRWVNEAVTELTVTGRHWLDTLRGPAIFICNHASHLDTPVFVAAMPSKLMNNLYFGAAADRWFVKGRKKMVLKPWYQSLVMGNFPIVRGGGSKTLDHAKWLLDRGCNLCIFPEGTRATSENLGRFRAGVPLLALEKNVPVVPVYLGGLRELRPKGQREVTPGPVSVEIMQPVRLAPGTPVDEAIARLWEPMNAAHVRYRSLTDTGISRTGNVADATDRADNDSMQSSDPIGSSASVAAREQVAAREHAA